jgi:hypothetical protein
MIGICKMAQKRRWFGANWQIIGDILQITPIGEKKAIAVLTDTK